MACGQEDSTCSFVFPDDIGGSWCGKNGVLSDDELAYAVGRADFQNGLNSFWREVSTIAADDKRRILDIDRVKDGLDEVLRIVLVQ